jgi:hypothetical protein
MKLNQERIDMLASNIRNARNAVSEDQMNRGRAWYQVAHDLAEMIGNGDVRKGAGVIAALSPRMQWDVNVRKAIAACNGEPFGCMGSSMVKAQAILDGADPEDVLPHGKKTHHFYRNILDPDDPEFCTIDIWAYRVATGDRSCVAAKITDRDYAECVAAYGIVADEFGELRNVTQAGCWVAVRETK